ncbi:MAG: hypothetical protein QOE89_456 [Pseudonocardiales bacterium]|nr:hypothetical protein [Pseudonocardiales bacterium]
MSRRATKSQIHNVLDTASTSAKSLADGAKKPAASASKKIKRSKKKKFGLLVVAGAAIATARSLRKPH